MTTSEDVQFFEDVGVPVGSVELAGWTIDAAILTPPGTSIDEVLVAGGTFFGRDALDAWRFLPSDGWRLVIEEPETRVYAAPEPETPGEWAVATLRLVDGVWNAIGAERNVFPRRTSAKTHDLELFWPADQVIVRGRPPVVFAKVRNHSSEPWLADTEPLSVVAWLIELPSNRRLLASRAALGPGLERGGGKPILVPQGASIVVPVRLATIAPASLLPGSYGIVGRLEQLDLTSKIGTVTVVER